jgi:hypothetical protein
MSPDPEIAHSTAENAPIALDGIAYGIDYLDAILVFHLGDARLHASWIRPDAGLRAEDIVGTLRDAYRVCQFAARRIAGGTDRRGERVDPVITIELAHRVAQLRRIRSHVVACLFDGAMPLGMARLIALRIGNTLEPELPLTEDAIAPAAAPALGVRVPPIAPLTDAATAAMRGARLPRLPDATADDASDRGPATLSFGASRRRSLPPARATPIEQGRTRALLAYLEAHAPEPHVVRTRLALRAGIGLVALDHPETLGPDAMVLIETAVEDILGQGRAELARIT